MFRIRQEMFSTQCSLWYVDCFLISFLLSMFNVWNIFFMKYDDSCTVDRWYVLLSDTCNRDVYKGCDKIKPIADVTYYIYNTILIKYFSFIYFTLSKELILLFMNDLVINWNKLKLPFFPYNAISDISSVVSNISST